MARELSLYDAMSILYADFHSATKEDVVCLAPVSGVKALLRKVVSAMHKGHSVAVFFDTKTDRKLLMPEYKKGRAKEPSVYFQAELAQKILKEIGVNCYSVPNFEADDLIYSYCEQYRTQFDAVHIHTADTDLANCIIDHTIELVPVSSQSHNITYYNFCAVLNDGANELLFNSLSLRKVLIGDKSDNIGAYPGGREIYRTLIEVLKPSAAPAVLRSKELALGLIGAGLLPDTDEIRNRIEIFYPRIYTFSDRDGFSTFDSFDKYRFVGIIKTIKDYDSLRFFTKDFREGIPPSETFKEELFELGKDFSNGVYHADRDMNIVPPQGNLLDYSSEFMRDL